jgi:tetratricopeptide (TPR) repeat protein
MSPQEPPASGPIGPDDLVPLIEQGRQAEASQQWELALDLWQRLREHFPQHAVAYIHGPRALASLGRRDEAELWLAEGMARHADNVDVMAAWARLSEQNENWGEAAERWSILRDRLPHLPHGFIDGMFAFLRAGNLDAAEEVAIQAQTAHPAHFGILMTCSRVAMERRDQNVALARLAMARERFPGEFAPYTTAVQVLLELSRLDEVDALLSQMIDRFPHQAESFLQYAAVAGARNDLEEQLRRYQLLRERFPNEPAGYIHPMGVLFRLRRYRDAERIALNGMARFPNVLDLMQLYADAAWLDSRLSEASERFATMRREFPASCAGFLGGSRILMHSHHFGEAVALLNDGAAAFPGDAELAILQAMAITHLGIENHEDRSIIGNRLLDLVTRFPDYRRTYIVAADIFCWTTIDDAYAADGILREAFRRWPREFDIGIAYVRIAERLDDPSEMVRRGREIEPLFSSYPETFVVLAKALANAGQLDDADALLTSAVQRFPAHKEFHTEFASMATRRSALSEAVRRWTEVPRRFPTDEMIAQRLLSARFALLDTTTEPSAGNESEAAAPATPWASADQSDDGMDVRTLSIQFESLGGDIVGCEFGLFQRAFGAEPLGLMRWAALDADQLVAYLDGQFEGMGSKESTSVIERDYGGPLEYEIKDSRFGMAMRSYVMASEMSRDQMLSQARRRLQFLSRKMRDDLASGAKIFVYRTALRSLTHEEILGLRTAMRRYGNNWLLYMRYSDAQHPGGLVELVDQGLMIGYLDAFHAKPDATHGPQNLGGWIEICRRAYQLRTKAEPATSPSAADSGLAGRSSP